MSLSNFAVRVLFIVGLTCLTGTVWLVLWRIIALFCTKRSNAEFVYRLLRISLLGFAVPWIAVMRIIKTDLIGGSGWMLVLTPRLALVAVIGFAVWLIGACATAGIYLVRFQGFCSSTRSTCRGTVEEQELLLRLCEHKHIRRPVQVYKGYRIMVPCVRGIRRVKIYLPMDEIPMEELEMILNHELNHYKQRDVFWKPLMVILCCVYWFMPLIWYISKQVQKWSEASCDHRCYRDGYSLTYYFESILRMGERTISLATFAPTWGATATELKWRIDCMKQNRDKSLKRWVAVLTTAGMLLTGSTTVFAAETGIEKAYDQAYEATAYAVDETAEYESAEQPEYEEFTCSEEEMFAGTTVVDAPVNITRAYANWTIKNGYTMKTPAFHKDKGGQVYVAGTISPSEKYVTIGITQPDGSIRAIKVSGNFSFTFKDLAMTGSYRVFIQNTSGSTVTCEVIYN